MQARSTSSKKIVSFACPLRAFSASGQCINNVQAHAAQLAREHDRGSCLKNDGAAHVELALMIVGRLDDVGENGLHPLLADIHVRGNGLATATQAAHERLYHMSSHELVDLADMQRAVSGQASRLAAERSTPDFVTRLGAHIDHLERASTHVEQMRIDGRFLIEVAAASQSVRLTTAEMRLQAETNTLRWLTGDGQSPGIVAGEVITNHRRLIAAIETADGVQAQSISEARVDADLQRLIATHMRLLHA